MAISIGMLLNAPKLRAGGMETLAAWAKNIGLDALEMERPEDYAEAAPLCRARGLQISGVRGASGAQTLSRDERTREDAVRRMREQIRALPQAGSRVLILVLVPEDPMQPIADSLAIYRETFPAI